MIFDVLRGIDLFKTPIQITYKHKPQYTTIFGTFISFIVIILLVVFAVFFSRNITKKINPYVIYQEETVMQYPTIPITQANYTMGVKVIKDELTWTKEEFESILIMRPLYVSYINGTYDLIEVPYKLCEEIYPDISNTTINSDQFLGALCPYNFSFPIFGNPETGEFGLFTNIIYKCVNSTRSNRVCKSEEEIKDSMMNTQFKILYFDNILYSTDYNQPLHKITSAFWDFLDIQSYKNIEFYFKSVMVDTDDGILLESINTEYGAIFDTKLYTKSLIRTYNQELPLFQIDIKVKNQRIYCKRIYEKIQNVLANLGGIIKLLMTAGLVFIVLVNKTVIKFDMVNDFYDFSDVYESDLKKHVEIRKMAKAGVRYSEININESKNNKNKKDITFDKNSKSNVSFNNSSNQPQAGNQIIKQQVEMEKINKDIPNSYYKDLNQENDKENYVEPDSANLRVENEGIDDHSYIHHNDISNNIDKIGCSVKLQKKSIQPIPDNSNISSRMDITLAASHNNTNRILNLPELDRNTPRNKISEPKTFPNDGLSNLSEEYLLRKKKHYELSHLTYSPMDIILITFPIKKFNEKLQRKSDILKKGYEKIMEVLDVTSFMHVIHDLNLLKGMFLNEDQIRLSKYIKKIMFTEDMLKPDLESEILKMKNYYLKFINSNQDQLDKKLFINLDDDLLFVLKN